MPISQDALVAEDLHPIDVAESLAAHRDWDFDRLGDDQIALAVEGRWRSYSLTLAWSPRDETLRLVASFEITPPEGGEAGLLDLVNRINDDSWTGAFGLWAEQKLIVWRYGLIVAGGHVPGAETIERMIAAAVSACERYYPAFQLVGWGGQSPAEALKVAIADACGRA